jgi:hypothetical protein
MTMTDSGGTVRYHEAEWIGEKIKPIYPWMVRFMEDGPIHELTKAEGEAMGLTPPPPPIDFDALPVGTMVADDQTDEHCLVKAPNGVWYTLGAPVVNLPRTGYSVVHVPDAAPAGPPSKADALAALGLTGGALLAFAADAWTFPRSQSDTDAIGYVLHRIGEAVRHG